MTRLKLGFSPCPNDTFIFFALINGLLEMGELSFEPLVEDVQRLNELALRRELDITKLSFAAFGHIAQDYLLLNSGAALGRGVGPLVISKEPIDLGELKEKKIAAPGSLTTANLLLKLFLPDAQAFQMRFDEIIDAVLEERADAGVIIHESRFVYEEKGLSLAIDLGKWWEEQTGLPLPLGGIFAKRSLGKDLIARVDSLIKESLNFALSEPAAALDYVKRYASELKDEVIRAHIELYVNDFSLDLKEEGKLAAACLLEMGAKAGIFPALNSNLTLG